MTRRYLIWKRSPTGPYAVLSYMPPTATDRSLTIKIYDLKDHDPHSLALLTVKYPCPDKEAT